FATVFLRLEAARPCSPARTGTPARCSQASTETTTASRQTDHALETGAAPAKSNMRAARRVARREAEAPPTHAGASGGVCSGAQATQIHLTPAQEESSSETRSSTACSV